MRRFYLLILLLLLFRPSYAPQAQTTLKFKQLNLQHGMATSGNFIYSTQANVLSADSTDCVTSQEVSTGDLGTWDTAFAANGFSRRAFAEHLMGGEGNAIWCRDSTVTTTNDYSRQLVNVANPTSGSTTTGWAGTSDIRRTAVAVRGVKGGRVFFLVSVHFCPSACADSSGSQFSVQRVSQAEDLVSWSASTFTGAPIITLGDFNMTRDMPKAPSGFQFDTFTGNGYTDLWAAGLSAGTAIANWGDRDNDGQPDMPLGLLTTRTHDSRGIDYAVTKGTGVALVSIDVPDMREVCPHALVAGGVYPSCAPEVIGGPFVSLQQWDIPEDFGVRPSDHNLITVTVTLADGTNGGAGARGKVTLSGTVRANR